MTRRRIYAIGLSLAVVALVTAGLTWPRGGGARSGTTNTNPTTPPPAAVRRVHAVLHHIGHTCKPSIGTRAQHELMGDVQTLVAFAHRYPAARFRIDDENAQTVSLLLVARQALQTCAPAAAAAANRALPVDLRRPPSGNP